MAGLGRKVFTRERATVADVQGYLMDQVVMRFASASAANAAITTPSEGMVRYLDDTNRHEFYTGAAWVPWLPRIIGRTHTPVSSSIPSGNARESGVADGPAIAAFTVYRSCRLRVLATFRIGQAVVGTGAALPYIKLDGVSIANGVSRSNDETMMMQGWVDVAAGTHTVGLRVEAFGGGATWVSSVVTIDEGAAE